MLGVYGRVSTLMQVTEGTSLDSQIEQCMKKAAELGFKSHQIEIFREEGFSGEDIERPELNRLREMVADGLISLVIVTHPDRLSRDMTDKLLIMREFEKNGAEIQFTDTEYSKTPEGQLFFNILSAIAAYELALIKKRTVRGRLKAVEKDKKVMPMRVAPYGYDLNNSKLTINEEEAKFVEKIYYWYVNEGLTLRQIGDRLYEQGAIPKRKESMNFGASSIRRILTSEIYIGRYIYNKRKTQKKKGEKTASGKPKKIYDYRDSVEWKIIDDIPAIIDKEIYEKAQEQKEKNKTQKGGNIKNQYLLKGLIRCPHCNRTWNCTTYSGRVDKKTGERMRYPIYRCPNMFPKKYGEGVVKCPSKTIRTEILEEYIWELIIDKINKPDEFLKIIDSQKSAISENWEETLQRHLKRIELKEKEREKIKVSFYKEWITEEEMENDMEKLNAELKILRAELDKLEIQIGQYKNQQFNLESIKSFICSVREMIERGNLSFEDKRYIIEKLISEIRVDYTEGEDVVVSVIGVLDDIIQTEMKIENDIELSSQREKI